MAGIGRHHADEALIAALAAGLTQQQAAKQAGISEKTVRNRLADPVFAERLQAARAEVIQRTADALTSAGTAAVRTLLGLLEARSETARHAAARTILEMALRIREANDLEQRLIAIEQELERQKAKESA